MALSFQTIVCLALSCAFFTPAAAADSTHSDKFYQERFCAGMKLEFRLENNNRVDCVSATHAIEVEFQDKWKEGVGQSLAYAAATGLRPGIVMVCRNDQKHCTNASLYIRQTFSAFKLPLTLWECLPIDLSLEQCLKRECGPSGCE